MDSSSQELKRAAFDGNLDRVRSLVESGADVNAVDQLGSGTLLTFHPSVIEYLLSRGADPTIPDAHGETPAHWAGWHRRPREIIDLLGPPTS